MATIKDKAISLICSAILILYLDRNTGCQHLDKLTLKVTNFISYSSSATDNVIEKVILRGRPFGGLIVYINKKYAKYEKRVQKSDRFIVVK